MGKTIYSFLRKKIYRLPFKCALKSSFCLLERSRKADKNISTARDVTLVFNRYNYIVFPFPGSRANVKE